MTAAPDELTDGAWVIVRGVLRWRPDPPLLALVPDAPARPDLTKLIACPTCHAVVTECCRSKSGWKTAAHSTRLVPKLCPCGERPERNHRYCATCAHEQDLKAKRNYKNRCREAS